MASVTVPVGEWLPDLPDYGNPGATVVKNVRPEDAGYGPLESLGEVFGTLTERCQGFFPARDSAGTVYNFSGDDESLYKLINLSWSDISTASFSYATAVDDFWEFVQWNDTVIATNGTDAVQRTSLSSACTFASLPGAPPIAKHIAVVKDFVVLGNISTLQQRVQWCAIDNPDSWTVTVATQADFQDIKNAGQVQRIVGGEYGTVFMEKQIVRMQYIGHPGIFSFEPIDRQRGAWNSAAVVPLGDVAFYLAETGFFIFNGSQSIPISNRKMERFFMRDLDVAYVYRVFGAADVERNLVMWVYPGAGNASGTPNHAVIYNWVTTQWSYAEFESELLAVFLSPGYTLDELDSISTSVDLLPYPLDSRFYQGGLTSFGGFTTNHKLGIFAGFPILPATVETGEIQHAKGRRSTVNMTRPLVDGDGATISVGQRSLHSNVHTFGSAVSQRASGYCPVRVDDFYHRYRIKTTGTFKKIQGVEVEFEPGGKR